MKLNNKWLLLAFMLALSAVFLVSTANATGIDSGYVGTGAAGAAGTTCLSCHDGSPASDKTSFLNSGHPWKYEHTGGATPGASAPMAAAWADKRPGATGVALVPTYLDGDAYQDSLLSGLTGLLPWDKINYTVGGFGWKMRWGIKDSTDAYTGYLWTGPAHQYKLWQDSYQQVYGASASPKKYSCAICHNTNGTSSTDTGCSTALGTAIAGEVDSRVGRQQPWDSNAGMDPSNHGGYYSEWTFDGVQCEACHGKGSNAGNDGHANLGTAASATVLVMNSSTGAIETSTVYDAGQVPSGKVEICARCHIRSTNTSGVGSECGADANVNILSRGAQKNNTNFINHHEQYNEMMGVTTTTPQYPGVHASLTCTSCHDPHKRTASIKGAVANALGLGAGDITSPDTGAVRACTECHYSGKYDVDGAAGIAGHASITCVSCHMAEASMTTSNTQVGSVYGLKGDLKTHIFKIDPTEAAATAGIWVNNGTVDVAKNFITVKYACGKCHDTSINPGAPASMDTLSEAAANAANYHGTARGLANIDGGFVGTNVCLDCHTEKESFLQTGHPWKYEHTGGAAPDPNTAPLADAWAAKRPQADLTWLDGDAYQDGLLLGEAGTNLIDWTRVGFTIGGFGWKMRWGINDPADTYTGYIWTGPKHQYKLWDDGYQQVYGASASPKKYSCAVCHNTNGTTSTDANCITTLGTAVSNAPGSVDAEAGREEPWVSTGLTTTAHGGYYSEWTFDGVQCEECHGTGRLHATAASTSNITVNESADLCGKCHTRSNNSNNPSWGSECGGTGEILANGATMADSNYINHHEQYNELMGLNNDGVHAVRTDLTPNRPFYCVDCHDVHKRTASIKGTVADALGLGASDITEPAAGAVVSCESCHGEKTLTMSMPGVTCVDCHMAEMSKTTSNTKQGDWGRKGDLKTHIFDINPAATTITRPNNESPAITVAEKYISVAYACGKCHDSNAALAATYSGLPLTQAQAQSYAVDIHNARPIARFSWSNDSTTSYRINFSAAGTTCPTGYTCTYSWDFTNDGSTDATGITTSNTYAGTGPYTAKLTVAATNGQSDGETHSVTPAAVNAAPTCGTNTVSYDAGNRKIVTFTQSGAAGLDGSEVLYINWGDGSPLTATTPNSATTHTYGLARQYTLKYMVKDSGGQSCKGSVAVDTRAATCTVTVDTDQAAAGDQPLSGATVYVKTLGGSTRCFGLTGADGSKVCSSLAPNSYKVYIYKTGKTFDGDGAGTDNMPVTVTCSGTPSTASATFIYTP